MQRRGAKHERKRSISRARKALLDKLALPFDTTVLGVAVTVQRVDLNQREEIVAVCRRGGVRQTVPILDLPLPSPPPHGAEWIDAYRHWLSAE